MGLSLSLTLLIMLACIALEAFFSGSEIAIVSTNRNTLKHLMKQGSKKAKYLYQALQNPEWLLSTTLFGTNFSTITLNAVATSFVIYNLGKDYEFMTIFITAPLVLFFGEVLPKAIFQNYANALAFVVIKPLKILSTVLSPLVQSTAWIVRKISVMLGFQDNASTPFITRDELETIFKNTSKKEELGLAKNLEKQMVDRAFKFSEKYSQDIMIPLIQMVSLSENITVQQAKKVMQKSGFSRMPVYRQNINHIVGWITHHDLIRAQSPYILLSKIFRPAHFTPDNINIDYLLIELQKQGLNLTFVVDEFGGVIGMITMEDILEEIIGDVEDEHDEGASHILDLAKGQWLLHGEMPIEDVNKLCKTKLPKGPYETLAGFLMQQFRRIPKDGASIQHKQFTFVAEHCTERCIEKIRIKLNS